MKTKTVLLVEDDSDTREIYRAILEHRGLRVMVGRDGEEGVEVAKRSLPDLVLLDVDLPGVDGWEVCSRLRADERTAAIPVVIVSIYPEDEAPPEWAGCATYLQKPCTPVAMVQEVARILGPSCGGGYVFD